jgi:hypothetical protein
LLNTAFQDLQKFFANNKEEAAHLDPVVQSSKNNASSKSKNKVSDKSGSGDDVSSEDDDSASSSDEDDSGEEDSDDDGEGANSEGEKGRNNRDTPLSAVPKKYRALFGNPKKVKGKRTKVHFDDKSISGRNIKDRDNYLYIIHNARARYYKIGITCNTKFGLCQRYGYALGRVDKYFMIKITNGKLYFVITLYKQLLTYYHVLFIYMQE